MPRHDLTAYSAETSAVFKRSYNTVDAGGKA